MALSTLAKEQENFLRYAILIVDHSKEALQDLVELNLKNKQLTFREFLDKNQHEIYHLCYDFRCCQCQNSPPRKKRIIFPSQLELLFDKYSKLPSHRGTGHNDFCCSYAKVGITSQVLDLSLARCLLVNCALDVFWFTCLTSQGQTLQQFLNLNKHNIYHLWKNNQNCCQCPPGYIFPCDSSIITEREWKSMFRSQLSPCEIDRKRMSTGSSSVCSVGATPIITTQDINPEIQRLILHNCSQISKAVEFLVEQRNLRFAHVPEAKISDNDFGLFLKDIGNHLLGIARVCGKETNVKKNLRDLLLKPLSLNMLGKYDLMNRSSLNFGCFTFTVLELCPFTIEKMLIVLFPISNYSLSQPDVIKLIHNAYDHKIQIKFELWWCPCNRSRVMILYKWNQLQLWTKEDYSNFKN